MLFDPGIRNGIRTASDRTRRPLSDLPPRHGRGMPSVRLGWETLGVYPC